MFNDKLVLGKNAEYSLDPKKTGLNNNIIICGPSGCGKTESILEKRLIETNEDNLVVSVSKRKVVDKYMGIFRRKGYKVYDLNFINPERSNISYDPLNYVKTEKDIKNLSEAIIMSDKRKGTATNIDPYWDEVSASLLNSLISFVLTTEDDPSFNSVLKLFDQFRFTDHGSYGEKISTSLDRYFESLENYNPHCYAITCWKSFKELPEKTARCAFGTLSTIMDSLFTPELRKMLSSNKAFDIDNFATEKSILFISTSPVNRALHSYVNIFYGQMIKRLFEFAEDQPFGELPIPIHFLLDDFACGCKVLDFPEYISIIREKRISTLLVIQSESQLEAMYGYHDAITIINNCDTYVYMGGQDSKTCKNISEKLDLPYFDVLHTPLGKEYIFRRGSKPICTERYEILKDKDFIEASEQYARRVRRTRNHRKPH